MSKGFWVELTTLCMIENEQGEILIQDRQKSDWPGWTFPGGHVEKNESLSDAVAREILEECGLNIQPELRGIAEWRNNFSGDRELAGLFYAKTTEIPRNLSDHGEKQFFVPQDKLKENLAGTLGELLPIFLDEGQKTFYQDNAKKE